MTNISYTINIIFQIITFGRSKEVVLTIINKFLNTFSPFRLKEVTLFTIDTLQTGEHPHAFLVRGYRTAITHYKLIISLLIMIYLEKYLSMDFVSFQKKSIKSCVTFLRLKRNRQAINIGNLTFKFQILVKSCHNYPPIQVQLTHRQVIAEKHIYNKT